MFVLLEGAGVLDNVADQYVDAWLQPAIRRVSMQQLPKPERGLKPRGCRITADSGITLVELLVVLVILSIALSVVGPSMGNSYENWTLRSAGQKTVALFRFASDVARRDG